MKRSEVFDAFAAANVRVDDGLAFRTDDATERLWQMWSAAGCPSSVIVGIDSKPNGDEYHWIKAVNPKSTESVDVSSLF